MLEHVYIHVPFCGKECPYCAFYKHRNGDLGLIRDYLGAVVKELESWKRAFELKPRTIYFGGGTPSILSLSQLEYLLPHFQFSGVEEFSFECNPATISKEKAELLKKFGVNRISLGVQSFEMYFLRILGRTHRKHHVQETIKRLRDAGFENINIDLMFGLPDQTLEHWEQALEETVKLNPEHISAYNLTYEEDTPFLEQQKKGLWKIDEELNKEMFLFAHEFLAKNGFTHYEISNYAREGCESIHNLAYWEGKDYVGIGPSACGTVGEKRWKNVEDTVKYVESIKENDFPEREEEALSEKIKKSERIFLGLRTNRGVAMGKIEEWKESVKHFIEEGWGFEKEGHFILTPEGWVLADEISKVFI